MLSDFLDKQLKKAEYKILDDDTYFGEIPGLKGVWANAKNLENCRSELREVLEEWLFLKIKDSEEVPGFEIKTDKRSLVKSA